MPTKDQLTQFDYLLFMNAGVWILGYVAALLILLGLCWWVLHEANERIIRPWWARAVAEGQRGVRERLLRDASWFSEDPATFHLIIRLANDAQDISAICETWRKESRRG